MGFSASLPQKDHDGVRFRSKSSFRGEDSNKTIENEEHSKSAENLEDCLEWLEDKNEIKDMTEKELQTRRERVFRLLNMAIDKISKIQDPWHAEEKWRNDLSNTFILVKQIYWIIEKIGPLSIDLVNKYRLEVGQELSKTKCISVMCKVIMGGWHECYKKEEDKIEEPSSGLMRAAFSALWNFSDCTPEATYDIVAEKNFLETLIEILTSHLRTQNHNMETNNDHHSWLVYASLCVIYNTSQVEENITRLREAGFVAVITMYLDVKFDRARLTALAAIANIIDEKESKILQTKEDLFQHFLKILEYALEQPTHRCPGEKGMPLSAKECAMTIRCLARNDANKKLLVKMGCFPHLVNLAKCGTVDEQRETRVDRLRLEKCPLYTEAVGAIWVLAFDEDNQRKILEDTELNIVDLLIDIRKTSKDKEVKKAADGTLWILRGKLENNETYKRKGFFQMEKWKYPVIWESLEPYECKTVTGITTSFSNWKSISVAGKRGSVIKLAGDKDKKGHVMISYNWSHQEELVKIRDKLKANGHSVWMDIDNMGGSTLQAMAEAVELAHVVLICMSQSYKDSPNCRAEAEYAYELRKIVVPLKMEAGYKPDGWLGIIIGSKIFYDFSGKYPFETKCKGLLKELASCFAKGGEETKAVPNISKSPEDSVDAVPVSTEPRSVAHPGQQTSLATLQRWTPMDVSTWLDKHNLSSQHFGHLTGKDLTTLVKMRAEAPEYFYNCLERKLKIDSLSIMGTFTDALEDLTS